jgi:alcohol dehydrogenase class IV
MRSRAFGIISSFGHVIDTLYPHVDHGQSYSLTTAAGMRFNLDQCTGGLARLGREVGAGPGLSDRDAAIQATDFVESFYRDLGMPVRLRDVGIPKEGIAKIAEDCMGDFYLHQNARKVKSADELLETLERMW